MTSHPAKAKAGTEDHSGAPILQLRDATVEIDRARLVDGISLDLVPGTVTGLVGGKWRGKVDPTQGAGPTTAAVLGRLPAQGA